MSMASAPVTASPLPVERFSRELLKSRPNPKLQFLFYGDTGCGKSAVMLSLAEALPGLRMLVFSFDGQTQETLDGMFGANPNVHIVDGMALYAAQTETFGLSGAESIAFIEWAIDELAGTFHPHIIAFDGLEKMNRLGEGKMRHLHGLTPSQGFAERAYWKDRNLAIDGILRTAASRAALGVAQTVYYEKSYGEEGSTDTKEKTPKYIDAIHGTMSVVVECKGSYSRLLKTNKYEAYVQFSRPTLFDVAVTGETYDVTSTFDKEKQAWSHRLFPWGPGLRRRFEQADRPLKGVPWVSPGRSDASTDELRAAHLRIAGMVAAASAPTDSLPPPASLPVSVGVAVPGARPTPLERAPTAPSPAQQRPAESGKPLMDF